MRYIYNGNNLYQSIAESNTGSEWSARARATYTWNTNNLVTKIEYEIKHYIYGFWYYTGKDEYYYDSTNRLIMNTGFGFSGGWVFSTNDIYVYDQNSNKTEHLLQIWDPADSSWSDVSRYLYVYNINNLLINKLFQNWDSAGAEWKDVWRESYTYNNLNNIESTLKEIWTNTTGWQNYSLILRYYDIHSNWVESVTRLWDETYWRNSYRYLAVWLEPVAVMNEKYLVDNFHLYNNYPNPFNPVTTIAYRIGNRQFVSLKVFDTLGKEIATLVREEKPSGNYRTVFNASRLASGIYYYQLRAGNFIKTKKMVVLK